MERKKGPQSKIKPELPQVIVCQVCGKERHALHAHLKQHQLTISEYRAQYGIAENAPLFTQQLSEHLSMAKKESLLSRLDATRKSKSFNRDRRAVLKAFEEQGLFTVRRASRLTRIPLSTLHSAISDSRLPVIDLCILVSVGNKLVRSGLASNDFLTQMLKPSDLVDFPYRPKYPRS